METRLNSLFVFLDQIDLVLDFTQSFEAGQRRLVVLVLLDVLVNLDRTLDILSLLTIANKCFVAPRCRVAVMRASTIEVAEVLTVDLFGTSLVHCLEIIDRCEHLARHRAIRAQIFDRELSLKDLALALRGRLQNLAREKGLVRHPLADGRVSDFKQARNAFLTAVVVLDMVA